MKPLDLQEVQEFVNENIIDFHQRKIKSLEELELKKLLKKNPYLFKAKNITTGAELVESLLAAFLSSSEEKLFGDFLDDFCDDTGAIDWVKLVEFNSSNYDLDKYLP